MIKFSSGKALSAGPGGDLQVVVDDETLSVQDGRLAIKSVPQTAVVIPTAAVTYSGAINDFDKGTYVRGTFGSQSMFNIGTFLNIVYDGEEAGGASGNPTIFTIDLEDHFDSASNVTSVKLYNFIVELDFTNISILANTGTESSTFWIQALGSDSPTTLTNSGTPNATNFFSLKGPVFPNAKIEYTLNQIDLKPSLYSSNRYIHVTLYGAIRFASDLSSADTLGIKVKGTPDTRLLMEGTGTVTNTLRNANDLFSTVTNDRWQESTGPGYDETVYD